MTSLIVQAHPVPDSFNAALLERVESGFGDRDEQPPRTFRLGLGDRPTSEDLAAADQLVLIYPTWWGGPPAVLIDWLHEVMLDPDRPFRSVRRLDVVTTCGGSLSANVIQGRWGHHWLRAMVLPLCATNAALDVTPIYRMDRLTAARATKVLGDVEQRFAPRSPASASRAERLRRARRRLA